MTESLAGQGRIVGAGNVSVPRFNRTGVHVIAAGMQSKLTFPVSCAICKLLAIMEFGIFLYERGS